MDEYFANFTKVNGLPKPPQLLRGHYPRYPEERLTGGETAVVDVQFTVDRLGKVQQVVVLDSSDPRFNASALHTVNSWRFERSASTVQNGIHTLQIKFRFEPDGAIVPGG